MAGDNRDKPNQKGRSKMCPEKKCKETKCSVIGCVLAGMASGVALGMVGKILLDSNKKALKKKADKMLKAMSDLGDSAMQMFQ